MHARRDRRPHVDTAVVLRPSGDGAYGARLAHDRPSLRADDHDRGVKVTTHSLATGHGVHNEAAPYGVTKKQGHRCHAWDGGTGATRGLAHRILIFCFYSFMRLHLPHFSKRKQPFKVHSALGKTNERLGFLGGKGRPGNFFDHTKSIGSAPVLLLWFFVYSDIFSPWLLFSTSR